MKHLNRAAPWRAGVVAVAALCAASCATKIEMRPEGTRLGSGVNPDTGALLDARTRFRVSDAEAVAWIEFKNAFGRHTARFQWFNDDGELVLDSGPVPVTSDDKLYAWRRVWSSLPIRGAPAQLMPGDWRVLVYFDDKKIETLKFNIRQY